MSPIAYLLLVTAVLISPSATFAQAPRAGVVTALEGTATVIRVPAPQSVALRPKDDVFLHDRIGTGERSTARLLLGKKALLTVRELSTLTITEIPRTSTVNLSVGGVALAVVKEKMRPGESIEIKMPNAIVAVRGTVVIAEVSELKMGNPSSGAFVSRITVVHGSVEVTPLDEASHLPAGSSVRVNTLEQIEVGGSTPTTPKTITPESARQIANDFEMKLTPREVAYAMPAALIRAHWQEVEKDAAKQGHGGSQKLVREKTDGDQRVELGTLTPVGGDRSPERTGISAGESSPAASAAVTVGGNPTRGIGDFSGGGGATATGAGVTVTSGNRGATGSPGRIPGR
jgi:FecR-like protein